MQNVIRNDIPIIWDVSTCGDRIAPPSAQNINTHDNDYVEQIISFLTRRRISITHCHVSMEEWYEV